MMWGLGTLPGAPIIEHQMDKGMDTEMESRIINGGLQGLIGAWGFEFWAWVYGLALGPVSSD